MTTTNWNLARRACILACCLFTVASSALAAEYCIGDSFAIGCRSAELLDQLLGQVDDAKAFDKTLEADIAAGACRRFTQGEAVDQVEGSGTPKYRRVHRPGESDAFWIPASYARPIAECRPSKPQAAARIDTTAAAKRGPSAKSGDRPPVTCVFKPVMSDAEIAACRKDGQ